MLVADSECDLINTITTITQPTSASKSVPNLGFESFFTIFVQRPYWFQQGKKSPMRKSNIGSGDVVVPDAPNHYNAGMNMNMIHLVYDTFISPSSLDFSCCLGSAKGWRAFAKKTKNLGPNTLFCRDIKICRNLLLWKTFGKKSAPLGQKQCFLGKRCTISWCILHSILN